MAKRRTAEIRRALLEEAFWSARAPVTVIAARFGVSRQAVQQQAAKLVSAGQLLARGRARWRRYRLAPLERHRRKFALRQRLDEDKVWETFVRLKLDSGIDPAAQDAIYYGLTEMVNNAIDHSQGTQLTVSLVRTEVSVRLTVADNGVGIFQKIQRELRLPDPRQALLELGKGKFTTDPRRHTGEGMFFTSRAFDRFALRSSELLFKRSSATEDWLVESEDKTFSGTRVTMALLLPARRKLEDVFSKYSSGPEDYRFAKTHVPLRLALFGDESLVSRSSAKRVLSRVERFDEVLLDFKRVKSVSPAFADEIFRVFANQHSHVRLIAINANEQVTSMIRRAQSHRDASSGEQMGS